MDQNKKCKFGTYYSELFKKTGGLAPAFGAALIFIALYLVHYIDLFAMTKASNVTGYWLMLVFSLIGVVLLAVYLATKIKSPELCAQDSFLLALDFLMVYLFLGTIIFDFLRLETVFYAVALLAVIVFNVLRAIFFNPEKLIEKEAPLPANTTIKKYFDLTMSEFGFWKLLLGAFGGFGFCNLLLYVLGFKKVFLTDHLVTAGIILSVAIFAAIFVICYIKRVVSKKISFVDGFLMFAFFTILLCGLFLISHFSALNLAIWLMASILLFALICILALSTHNDDKQTDDAYFITDGGKKFVKNPKVYFKHFVKGFNLILLGAISMFVFAVLDACVVLNFIGWVNGTKFMLYAVIAMILYYFAGLIYFGKGLKKPIIDKQDGLLAIFDVALLLLVFPIFLNLNMSGMIVSVIIWAIAFATTLAFTIARMFKVREEAPAEETPAAEAPAAEAPAEETSEK